MTSHHFSAFMIGLLIGIVVCLGGAALVQWLQSRGAAAPGALPPQGVAVEVAVDQSYLSRVLVRNVSPVLPWPMVAATMDMQAGNQALFDTRIQTPPGKMAVSGRLTFGTGGGRLLVHVAELKLGAIPVTPLVTALVPDMDAQITDQVNQQLQPRLSAAHLRLVGVTTGEGLMQLYFAGQ